MTQIPPTGPEANGFASGSDSQETAAVTQNPTEMTHDQIRQEMGRLYRAAQDNKAIGAYYDYCERMSALVTEYHRRCLTATFPRAEIIDTAGVVVYDLRQSPKSGDMALLQLNSAQDAVKRIVWDWKELKAYLITQ